MKDTPYNRCAAPMPVILFLWSVDYGQSILRLTSGASLSVGPGTAVVKRFETVSP